MGIAILVNGWIKQGSVNIIADTAGSNILRQLYSYAVG